MACSQDWEKLLSLKLIVFLTMEVVVKLLILALFLLCSCSRNIGNSPNPVPSNDVVPQHSPGWNSSYVSIVNNAVKTHGPSLLAYNKDPKFWNKFFCAVAGAESSYKTTETYWEKSLGVSCLSVWPKDRCVAFVKDWNSRSSRKAYIDRKGWDRVTKTFYLSEGLLQLSYSDAKYYSCDFDMELDRDLLSNDPRKTIFDPANNLECGVIIMNRLVKKKGQLYFNSGHYWAVLKPNNSRHKVFKNYLNQKCL